MAVLATSSLIPLWSTYHLMETDSNEFRMNPSNSLTTLAAQDSCKMIDDALIPSTGSIAMKSAVNPAQFFKQLQEQLVVFALSYYPAKATRGELKRSGDPHFAVGSRSGELPLRASACLCTSSKTPLWVWSPAWSHPERMSALGAATGERLRAFLASLRGFWEAQGSTGTTRQGECVSLQEQIPTARFLTWVNEKKRRGGLDSVPLYL